MRKLALLLVVVIIFVLIGIIGMFLWQGYTRDNMLSLMKERLEFCNVTKSEFSLFSGMFWMMCNGRPYYAEAGLSSLFIQNKGWSFLNQEALSDLNYDNCNFISSNSSKLLFYCGTGTLRLYDFNYGDFNMSKVGELNFSKPYLNCSYQDSSMKDMAVVSDLRCGSGNYEAKVRFEPDSGSYQLPIVTDQRLSDADKIYKSLAISFGSSCNLEKMWNRNSVYFVNLTCNASNLTVSYDLKNNVSGFYFPLSDFNGAFELLKKKIFPFAFSGNPEFLVSSNTKYGKDNFYLWNSRVMVAEVTSNDIVRRLYIISEGPA
jgi:hypothetical protein